MKRDNELKIGDAIRLMIREYGMQERFKSAGIEDIWSEVMGEVVAGYTEKVYVRKNVLWVKLNSAALKQELSYGRSKILSHMHDAMGEDSLEDIRFL